MTTPTHFCTALYVADRGPEPYWRWVGTNFDRAAAVRWAEAQCTQSGPEPTMVLPCTKAEARAFATAKRMGVDEADRRGAEIVTPIPQPLAVAAE